LCTCIMKLCCSIAMVAILDSFWMVHVNFVDYEDQRLLKCGLHIDPDICVKLIYLARIMEWGLGSEMSS